MHITNSLQTVDQVFFQPLSGLAGASAHAWPCAAFPDADFLHLGVQRVLESSPSGRGFLQEHGLRFARTPSLANYFVALKSARRGAVLRDVNLALVTTGNQTLRDRLADIPELAHYECFVADGHWHQAATHDARHEARKLAVGHFFSLNLRTHMLRHLAAAAGLHEHDMSALKRVKPKGLRQGVPKGQRVLTIYDKAGIDFDYWKRCRQECAVYFLSRVKENMVYDWLESAPWDRTDARNHGVTDDRRVMTRDGHRLRIVCYTDPATGEAYEFLTNAMDLPPGVVVELYRRRWEIEKVFDEIKNKLGEQKAWASTLVAKAAQALFIAIAHNLLVLYEQTLAAEHGVTNTAEDERRAHRTATLARQCQAAGKPLSKLVLQARGATQRSVKFVRWVRQSIRDRAAEALAVPRLRALYATL
jgi:hypothetical protein